MTKVLILSYYFPPAGGSAVQRVLKFVKYLPQFGWQPVVLTTRKKDPVLSDGSLVEEVPEDIEIIRTPAPDLYSWYTRMVMRTSQRSPLMKGQVRAGWADWPSGSGPLYLFRMPV